MLTDRAEGGIRLAEKLLAYRGTNAVVLALPRGGVITGYEIAHALALPLDIVAPRKIGHPSMPEYAIGAVDESGERILNQSAAEVDPKWLEAETAKQQGEAKRRITIYRGGSRAPVSITGKTVIIVDDGIATGLTMRLAVHSVKKHFPDLIVVAVPVAPPEAVALLRAEGAEVVVLEPPETFRGAVGTHYAQFGQVEDNEVIQLLNDASVHNSKKRRGA